MQTFVDTAVFDVKTTRLLFRAPGADKSAARSTAVLKDEAVRKERDASFAAAMNDMTGNLVNELASFEARVEENPKLAEVRWKDSHGGGGSTHWALLLLLTLLVGLRRVPSEIG